MELQTVAFCHPELVMTPCSGFGSGLVYSIPGTAAHLDIVVGMDCSLHKKTLSPKKSLTAVNYFGEKCVTVMSVWLAI